MGLGVLLLAIPIAIALFGLLGRHALEMRKERKHREMWGTIFWSFVPFSVVCVIWSASGDSSMLARNMVLGLVGGVIGASGLIWAGYFAHDMRARAQAPKADQAMPSDHKDRPVIDQSVTSYGQTGGITAHTVYVGTAKLRFDAAIGEEIVRAIPAGRSIVLRSVGSTADQAVATEYQAFLQSRGFNIERMMIGMLAPSPDGKISIAESGGKVILTIAPSG